MGNHLDNIVALATPKGAVSALAIIRVSGKSLHKLYKQLTKKNVVYRTAIFSKIYHPKLNTHLDDTIITFFNNPASFTGEDVIEISCHGSQIIIRNIISAIITSGARYANPGEFSLRAFYNGKIDLLQAESISEIIKSKDQLSIDAALNHLSGAASKKINDIKNKSIDLLTIIENELNFSEDEIDITTNKKISKLLYIIKSELEGINKNTLFGKEISTGYRVLLLGKPNAGKSSLFNALLAKEKAIVSNIKGTTRDLVEENIDLDGFSITLIDSAGLWSPKNTLDEISVKKTLNEIKKANICILLDEKNPCDLLQSTYLKNFNKQYLLVKTKIDLYENYNSKYISTSSKKNIGINTLLTKLSTVIKDDIQSGLSLSDVFLGARQRKILDKGLEVINQAILQTESSLSIDIVASTLKSFTLILEEMMGKINDKDIVEEIFSSFCIGK